jgi:molybdate transport system substrate-binding protein
MARMNGAERRWTPMGLIRVGQSLVYVSWLAAVLLAGAQGARAADLIVAAASDLAPLSSALAQGFERAPNTAAQTKVRFTFAASGSLAQQIENGAPFDVFLSADERLVKELVASGHLEPDVVTYATGRLGLWSKDGRVRSLEDLKKPGVIHLAIANPDHAPYGVAARRALETQGLWHEVQPKIVYGENVRQAMQFAESGNADAVITSWTLLIGRGVLLPAEWHDPIRQAGGVVKSSGQIALARQFLKFLTGAEGRRILQSGGLFPP